MRGNCRSLIQLSKGFATPDRDRTRQGLNFWRSRTEYNLLMQRFNPYPCPDSTDQRSPRPIRLRFLLFSARFECVAALVDG